jgi:hypothetical protein
MGWLTSTQRFISITHVPVVSMWVALHSLFLYSDSPPSCHPLAIFKPDLLSYIYPNNLNPSYSSYLPAYEDGKECSKMLAYILQTPANHPEESIQHSEHSESLKSRIICTSWGISLQPGYIYFSNLPQ